MLREIVKIDEEKCNGCGLCVPNCHEGALQIIDGKAVLISDLLCDGLGACVGHCPEGAITIEKREAEPYDEVKVMQEMVKKGKNVVAAHLKHLKEHNELQYLQQGMEYLMSVSSSLPYSVEEVRSEVMGDTTTVSDAMHAMHHGGGCPGSRTMSFGNANKPMGMAAAVESTLSHWPIQLHLINPAASHFHQCDLLIAADCTAFAFGNFHAKYLSGKKLVIACPKLDANKDIYLQKIIHLVEHARVNTITVMIMEVPCCGGLLQLVQNAVANTQRKVPVKAVVVGIQGDILDEQWV